MNNFDLDDDWDYDLAIAILENPVEEENKNIQSTDLPEVNAGCKGLDLVLSGWGSDRTRPYRPLNKLWAVKQRCLNISECNNDNGTVCTPDQCQHSLCVGDADKTNSGCYYDSGGIKITRLLKSVQ